MEPLRHARSALSVLAVMALFLLCVPVLYIGFYPLILAFPERRYALTSRFMKFMAGRIVALLELGGARFVRNGTIPTAEPMLVVMNHQSQVDILAAILMGEPMTPAFVTRARYARYIPLVSPCVRLIGGPIIDPKREARGAVIALKEAAARLEHGLLIFPEGHRTRDGEVQPFRSAGLLALLKARRLPVHLVVTDGAWRTRRLVDFVFNVHQVRCWSEVVGRFDPPADEGALEGFVHDLRETLIARLKEHRADRARIA